MGPFSHSFRACIIIPSRTIHYSSVCPALYVLCIALNGSISGKEERLWKRSYNFNTLLVKHSSELSLESHEAPTSKKQTNKKSDGLHKGSISFYCIFVIIKTLVQVITFIPTHINHSTPPHQFKQESNLSTQTKCIAFFALCHKHQHT